MAVEAADTSIRVEPGVLNKLVHLASELVLARDQFRAICDRTLVAGMPGRAPEAGVATRRTFVLFATPDEGRMAIALSQVHRIEEFDARDVFEKDGGRAVRYDGETLSLVEVSNVLPERRAKPRRRGARERATERVQVIVHGAPGERIALLVERLVDVFDEPLVQPQPGSREGAASSVLLRGRVTEIVDLAAMRTRALAARG